jgi:hydrogenase maturation protease
MNAKLIESIANAVLYEGYMLYPYRPSSVKNQQRWNFGVVYPKAYSEIQRGNDICVMQTQCLVRAEADAEIEIKVRFLQCIARKIGVPLGSGTRVPRAPEADIEIVDSATIGGQQLQSWQEASEREVTLAPICRAPPCGMTLNFRAAKIANKLSHAREPPRRTFFASAKRSADAWKFPWKTWAQAFIA